MPPQNNEEVFVLTRLELQALYNLISLRDQAWKLRMEADEFKSSNDMTSAQSYDNLAGQIEMVIAELLEGSSENVVGAYNSINFSGVFET